MKFAPEARRGKVARVINANRLVINLGEVHGVEVGSIYAVLRPENEQITDPETGEYLGEIELEKIRVRVSEVQQKLSIATPYRKVLTGGAAGDLFGPRKEVPERIELSRDEIPDVDKTVYIGDPVKFIAAD